jgi:hypothetical protein
MIKTCPKCGFQNNYQEGYEPEECKKCRIIFSKIKIRSDAEIESNNYNSESAVSNNPQATERTYIPLELEARQIIGISGSFALIAGIFSPLAYSPQGHVLLSPENILIFLALALISCRFCLIKNYATLRYTSLTILLLLSGNILLHLLIFIDSKTGTMSEELQFGWSCGLLIISIILLSIAAFYNTSDYKG